MAFILLTLLPRREELKWTRKEEIRKETTTTALECHSLCHHEHCHVQRRFLYKFVQITVYSLVKKTKKNCMRAQTVYLFFLIDYIIVQKKKDFSVLVLCMKASEGSWLAMAVS